MKALAIGRLTLTRFLRDRSNLFFVFIFPLALVMLLGLSFGGSQDHHVAVVAPDDNAATQLISELSDRDGITIDRYATRQAAIDAVARNRAQAAVILPEAYAQALRRGDAVVEFLTRPGGGGDALRPVVTEVVGEQAVAATAISIAAQVTGQPPGNIERHVEAVTGRVDAIDVEQVAVDGGSLSQEVTDLGRFDLAATTQLVLFVFIASLATASTLVRDRELHVITRMISTPTHTRDIIVGAAAGRLGVALFQGVYIMVGAQLLFGVGWGDPFGAFALVTVFSAVSAAAGLLLGSLVHNEAQASGLAMGLGLGLAALGGSMAPLDIFPETMRRVAHITPHAWANDAFADLVRHRAGPSAIVPELAVLIAMAAILLTAAIWQLRSSTIAQP